MTLDELRATKRDAILAIAARHGVSGIRVFGSFARERPEMTATSTCLSRRDRPEPLFPRRFSSPTWRMN